MLYCRCWRSKVKAIYTCTVKSILFVRVCVEGCPSISHDCNHCQRINVTNLLLQTNFTLNYHSCFINKQVIMFLYMIFRKRSYNAIEELREKMVTVWVPMQDVMFYFFSSFNLRLPYCCFCLFVLGFIVLLEKFSLHYWRKAAKFDLYSALVAIEDSLACHTYSDRRQLFI